MGQRKRDSVRKTTNLEKESNTYSAKDLGYLDDLSHVRRRAGTYIGDLGKRGLHHLVHEVVDNSLDEAMAGYADNIKVVIHPDQSIAITDNGRGIPVDVDQHFKKSALECVMTVLKYGGKFEDSAYQSGSGGLNGMGLKAVNFLSQWCTVRVDRDGQRYQQKYEFGKPITEVESIGQSIQSGTRISFLPDKTKFSDHKFDAELLIDRLQNAAFINQGVTIEFLDQRTNFETVFRYQHGLEAWVHHQQTDLNPVHINAIRFDGSKDDVHVRVAFRYHYEDESKIQSFANNIYTPQGGTHLAGFRNALARTLSKYGKREKLFGESSPITQDYLEGLAAIISIRLSQPQFESQNKIKLTTAAVENVVYQQLSRFLTNYWEENPEVAKAVLAKALVSARARRQVKLLRSKMISNAKTVGGAPGKLRDCTSNDPKINELYLVEGDSAGGSAEGGRVREFQAILPLRGKIINVFKATQQKVLAHEEVQAIVKALGVGIQDNLDLQKLKYHKIVIMSDADVDGAHIRTLLLSFFYRQMPELISRNHIFIAQPPLFRVRSKKESVYVQNERELRELTWSLGVRESKLVVNDQLVVADLQLQAFCSWLDECELRKVELDHAAICEHLAIDSNDRALNFKLHCRSDVLQIDNLNELTSSILRLGENGLRITRFKGLGEMNADELRETVLLPGNRNLVRVTMNNAQHADQMFQLLMGASVHPRRKFIERNALNVKNIDV